MKLSSPCPYSLLSGYPKLICPWLYFGLLSLRSGILLMFPFQQWKFKINVCSILPVIPWAGSCSKPQFCWFLLKAKEKEKSTFHKLNARFDVLQQQTPPWNLIPVSIQGIISSLVWTTPAVNLTPSLQLRLTLGHLLCYLRSKYQVILPILMSKHCSGCKTDILRVFKNSVRIEIGHHSRKPFKHELSAQSCS